ncbi:hypothetical protein MCERE19_00104 [Spirosomataceae bacterium]|jgi:hypothetical protein
MQRDISEAMADPNRRAIIALTALQTIQVQSQGQSF